MDTANLYDIEYGDWVDIRPERDWRPGVWLEVDDGRVVSIGEQYQP